MKSKVDENLPAEIVADLRDAGQDTDTVTDQGMTGVTDPVLLARIQAEWRARLTLDKDIANVRAYPPQQYAGIVLFRPHTADRMTVLTLMRHYLSSLLLLD